MARLRPASLKAYPFLHFVNEMLQEIQDAVPAQIGSQKYDVRNPQARRIPRTPELALVDGEKTGARPFERVSHEDKIRVDREVSQALPHLEERGP
ncbi:MAG: hypothetical protein ACREX3_13455 [Gammaproteobacteria bacterium]